MRDARWVKPELVCQVSVHRVDARRRAAPSVVRGAARGRRTWCEEEASVPGGDADAAGDGAGDRCGRARGRRSRDRRRSSLSRHPERVVDEERGSPRSISRGTAAGHGRRTVPVRQRSGRSCSLAAPRRGTARGSLGRRREKPKRALLRAEARRPRPVANIGAATSRARRSLYVTRPEADRQARAAQRRRDPWLGLTHAEFDKPDWIVLDLDPDVGLPFERVVEAALELRDELAKMSSDELREDHRRQGTARRGAAHAEGRLGDRQRIRRSRGAWDGEAPSRSGSSRR